MFLKRVTLGGMDVNRNLEEHHAEQQRFNNLLDLTLICVAVLALFFLVAVL